MIEKFETCQTKSIAKQTNRDESLIIRSILKPERTPQSTRKATEVHTHLGLLSVLLQLSQILFLISSMV